MPVVLRAGAGSDLASLRTRAGQAGRRWLLDGQKVWTSQAREADWAICLARTDPEAPKHQGISYFLVDMRSPGVEVRPLREANGSYLFNEVFLSDVFVPDDRLVGPSGRRLAAGPHHPWQRADQRSPAASGGDRRRRRITFLTPAAPSLPARFRPRRWPSAAR